MMIEAYDRPSLSEAPRQMRVQVARKMLVAFYVDWLTAQMTADNEPEDDGAGGPCEHEGHAITGAARVHASQVSRDVV